MKSELSRFGHPVYGFAPPAEIIDAFVPDFDPTDEVLTGPIRKFSTVYRWEHNGQRLLSETLEEHVPHMLVLLGCIRAKLEQYAVLDRIDGDRIARMVLLHDFGETNVEAGDVMFEYKTKADAEQEAAAGRALLLGRTDLLELYEETQNLDGPHSVEAQIFTYIDRTQPAHFALWNYQKPVNSHKRQDIQATVFSKTLNIFEDAHLPALYHALAQHSVGAAYRFAEIHADLRQRIAGAIRTFRPEDEVRE